MREDAARDLIIGEALKDPRISKMMRELCPLVRDFHALK